MTLGRESVLARHSKERSTRVLIAAAGPYCVPPLGAPEAAAGAWEKEKRQNGLGRNKLHV